MRKCPRRHQRCVGCGKRKRCKLIAIGYTCRPCRDELADLTRCLVELKHWIPYQRPVVKYQDKRR